MNRFYEEIISLNRSMTRWGYRVVFMEVIVRLYFAAPLFSLAERDFNEDLAGQLEALGFEVFLPQRDGVEKNRPPYNAMTPEERRRAIFQVGKSEIFACHVFLFILDGRVPDEGACVELGMAYCQRELQQCKKLLIGLLTDVRAAFPLAKLNPMLRVPLDYVATDVPMLLDALRRYLDSETFL